MKAYAIERTEKRVPMEIAVQVAGHPGAAGAELTFTENVSRRGARVLTARRWRTNDRLQVASLAGNFTSSARVAYCQSVPGSGYAIGLEMLTPSGRWVIDEINEPAA